MEYIDRNYDLVRDRMIHQMNVSLGYGKEILDSELDAGLLNFVIKPIVTSFYKYWTDKDANSIKFRFCQELNSKWRIF
jgi:hypothetical protein